MNPPSASAVETVRASFEAYQLQDAERAMALMSPSFRFTSPNDERIDRTEWLERCFPTADRFARQEFIAVEQTTAGVLAYYEYELRDGATYRNTELITVVDGLIVETQVFFGGRVPDTRKPAS